MARRDLPGGRPGALELEALFAPLRFAARHDGAGLTRLSGLGKTILGALERSRAAGATPSPALERLSREGEGLEALPVEGRFAAICRIASDLGTLVTLPEDLAALARRGRIPTPPVARIAPPSEGDAAGRAERRRRLATLLSAIPGAHPAPRALLEERGRETVESALEFLPRTWQDRTRIRPVAELRTGEPAIAVVTVRTLRSQRMRNGKPMLKVGTADGPSRLDLVFFNPPPWRQKQFVVGERVLVSGEVAEGFGGVRQMAQPQVEKAGEGDSANFGRVVPVYPGPADYQHPALRKLMKRLVEEYAPWLVEELPASVRLGRRLLGRADAISQAHFPPPGTDLTLAEGRATEPFRRLAYEELFFLQLSLALRRQGVRREPGIAFDASPTARAAALAPIPFRFTGAQDRAFGEIARDMGAAEPMHRLLQGDVGSGKTAVAFAAAMLAIRSGWQVAVMAPTEILAEQHVRTFRRWLEGSDVEVALVAARARGREQAEAREAVRSGRARLVVGTHALLEQSVEFARLGLVVVDEQHRFGVLQRATLMSKGKRPDVLVMTATPIPRTLAMAFYGDLDQSKIDEMPPGRLPVETRVFRESQRGKVLEGARAELDAGRQVYVVYPLVEESEKTDLADATSGAEELREKLAPHAVALVHGRMKGDEKEEVMRRFREGSARVLVSTTVVEVGLDVPNATVMIVEHAERFGLSQLHQLRGRVGRGSARSRCLLVARGAGAGADARERLRTMVETQDGFEIARADLRIRGPGEMLGTRQAGQPIFEVADLYRDEAILDEAREDALKVAAEDPELSREGNAATREALDRWASRLSLARVG
ncbi:MAG: ATP-dependent DNA helicase RecG [Deltaproteobacteria bacterium]